MDVKPELVPRVSIIIVNWNGLRHLKPLFDSIKKLDFDKKKLEVLMVDNASTDESVSFTKKNYSSIRILRLDQNYGFCGGNNRGIAEAKGDYILLLNNDVVVDKNLLNALLAGFSSPEVGAVGGKVYEWNEKNPAFSTKNRISSSWPKISPWRCIPFSFTDERPAGSVDYLPGCMLMVRKKLIEEIGSIDEDYQAYFEETDWCARMIRAGHKPFYTPDAMIWHRFLATANAISPDFNHRMMTRNRIRFVLKNFDFLRLFFFLLYYPFEVIWKFLRLNFIILRSVISTPVQRAHDILVISYYSRDLKFVFQSILWNLTNLPRTLQARSIDLGRLKNRQSYNLNLPLRNVAPNRRDL